MTGIEDFNFPAFHAAAKRLRDYGWEVDNPAEHFEGLTNLPIATYLRRDIESIMGVDAMVMLPGWRGNGTIPRGVKVELTVAYALGLPVLEYEAVGSPAMFYNVGEDVRYLLGFGAFPPVDAVPLPQPDPVLSMNYVKAWGEVKPLVSLTDVTVAYPELVAEETILQEAQRLVHGDRGQDYGRPTDDFGRTAQIWSALLGVTITPEQVALCMIGVKMSREVNKPKRDSRVDIAGYAECLQMVVEDREAGLIE